MDREQIIGELEEIIGAYLRQRSLELVELIYRFEAGELFLRVLADRPEGGITLEECASVNKELGGYLDEKNILADRYILEVSSPGLDRPLKDRRDFLRCLNKQVRVFLKQPINGKMEWEGIVDGVDEQVLGIRVSGRYLPIPLSAISKAKQAI